MGITAVSEDILRTLGLFTKDKKYNNTAALLSDENDFYGIDMAQFGNSINEIMDRETIEKTSVLKQYDAAVSMIKRYYQYEEISGIERKKIDLIPENAYREAIAKFFNTSGLEHKFSYPYIDVSRQNRNKISRWVTERNNGRRVCKW